MAGQNYPGIDHTVTATATRCIDHAASANTADAFTLAQAIAKKAWVKGRKLPKYTIMGTQQTKKGELEAIRERMVRIGAECDVHISPYAFDQSAHKAAASFKRKDYYQDFPRPTLWQHMHVEYKYVELSGQK